MHSLGDWFVFVVFVGDAVDYSFGVAWASLPFAVAVGGLVALPFPASVVLDAYEAVEACLFGSVEAYWRVWH